MLFFQVVFRNSAVEISLSMASRCTFRVPSWLAAVPTNSRSSVLPVDVDSFRRFVQKRLSVVDRTVQGAPSFALLSSAEGVSKLVVYLQKFTCTFHFQKDVLHC